MKLFELLWLKTLIVLCKFRITELGDEILNSGYLTGAVDSLSKCRLVQQRGRLRDLRRALEKVEQPDRAGLPG